MDQPKELRVEFYDEAKHWLEALPVGNGRLGAMVFGRVQSELIQLNEDTLWSGTGPRDWNNPKAAELLPQVRQLVWNGLYSQASELSKQMLGPYTEVYQPLGDLKLQFGESHSLHETGTYHRWLDLNTATAWTTYDVNGVSFTREVFASFPHQVVTVRVAASKPASVSFTVTLDSPLQQDAEVDVSRKAIVVHGECPPHVDEPTLKHQEQQKQGMKFAAVVQVRTEAGSVDVAGQQQLKVDKADSVTLLVVARSTFDGPFKEPANDKDPAFSCLAALESLETCPYDRLLAAHVADYQRLFHRVSLELESKLEKAAERISTRDRVLAFSGDEDPEMVTLLFQFGRYLLISSSRPGSFVANLQGIWNKDLLPAWRCVPHLNINLEMNYWPAEVCNLSECHEPLFDLLSCMAVNGSVTAKTNYSLRGWVVHHNADVWVQTAPIGGDPVYALWPMGGAWLCLHLWEHYLFSLDKVRSVAFSEPLLEGCALFLYDWLQQDSEGLLVTNPSTSPEHKFVAPDGTQASVSYGTTMDMAIIRAVFDATVSAAKILEAKTNEFLVNLKHAADYLLAPGVGSDGLIMEWSKEFRDPDEKHRHMSHLFGLFPGHSITLERTPELCQAAERSMIKRGDIGPGWSVAWKIALWSRLRRPEPAYNVLKRMFTLIDATETKERLDGGGLYGNLFNAHPPFQIDGNFGFTAAVAEMLLQSDLANVYLLPALPQKWTSGSVRGLRARGNVEVDIAWDNSTLLAANLKSGNKSARLIRVHYNWRSIQVELQAGSYNAVTLDSMNG